MTFTVSFKKRFSEEFARLQSDQQDKVLDFVQLCQSHGLGDFTKFPGKITQSWKGVDQADQRYKYAYDNALWHYHLGFPSFKQTFHGKYQTSDWVLHFQWIDWSKGGTHISLVDLYDHVASDGKFWLPKPDYLKE